MRFPELDEGVVKLQPTDIRCLPNVPKIDTVDGDLLETSVVGCDGFKRHSGGLGVESTT